MPDRAADSGVPLWNGPENTTKGMNAMKKWMSVLALLLAMVLLLAACGGQEKKETAADAPQAEPTATPAPTEPPKTEEELILERDAAAAKLSIEMLKTMIATAGEKLSAEEEGSKLARYYKRCATQLDADNPFRVIILTPTDEQFQAVKDTVRVDEEYKIAPALVKSMNTLLGFADYGRAADSVVAEADASAVGENVVVLIPLADVLAVSIYGGKAQSALIIGDGKDFDPARIPQYSGMLGVQDLGFRNYDGDALKTLLGQ